MMLSDRPSKESANIAKKMARQAAESAKKVRAMTKPEEPDFHDCANCYGQGCISCRNTGQIESQSHRERREEFEDHKADAIRKGEYYD